RLGVPGPQQLEIPRDDLLGRGWAADHRRHRPGARDQGDRHRSGDPQPPASHASPPSQVLPGGCSNTALNPVSMSPTTATSGVPSGPSVARRYSPVISQSTSTSTSAPRSSRPVAANRITPGSATSTSSPGPRSAPPGSISRTSGYRTTRQLMSWNESTQPPSY